MDNWKNEKSCGAVIENNGKILMIFQNNGFWGFPKGHVEKDETEAETAVREVFEETGVWVEINEENRFELKYDIEDLKIHKTTILFTAKLVDDSKQKKQDEEITELRWVKKSEVEALLTYDDWKDAWRKIEKVL
ncbi:NUDIX domain-containing protein [Candidatus Saccharibacteria bacterium]|nr:NUDIX domain-containing protein [Candidatus Saccharibacteria bacterium]